MLIDRNSSRRFLQFFHYFPSVSSDQTFLIFVSIVKTYEYKGNINFKLQSEREI